MYVLFKRICAQPSPTSELCIYFLSKFISDGTLFPGTLVERIVTSGVAPMSLLVHPHLPSRPVVKESGLADSLRCTLLSDNYVKPWSNEYFIVKFLTHSI